MGLPGFVTSVTLKRAGQTGHAADGTPVETTTDVWTKKGHYQQQQGTKLDTQLGDAEYQVYRFWLPFLTGDDRPKPGDILAADGYNHATVGIEQESLKHHIIVRAERVQR
jgi:hypothetical protein